MFRLLLVLISAAGVANGFQTDNQKDTYAICPPPDRQARFAGVLADFAARRNQHTRLVRELNIAKPYLYIDASAARNSGVGREATDIFAWRVFERDVFESHNDGQWEPGDWVHCITMVAR